MTTRISLRNLFVVSVAAAGLSIVPVGMANALPSLAHSGSTCRFDDKEYHQGAIIRIDGDRYRCWNGSWDFFGSSDFNDRHGY